MIGYSFGCPRSGIPGGTAQLALTGWWRADFDGSFPWVGTPSAGISGNQDMATGGIATPTQGTAVNGLFPIKIDNLGDSQWIVGDDTLATYVDATMACGWALIKATTTNGAISTILGSVGGLVNLYVYTTGASVKFTVDDNVTTVTRAITAGSWQLVTFRYDGTNIQIGVNEAPGAAGGASTAAYSTAIFSLAQQVVSGNDQANQELNADILDMAVTDVRISDAQFAAIKAYVNTRYGLSL